MRSECNVVFIVEDDSLILLMLEEALTEAGFAVARAISGEQAVAMLNAGGACFSALVTDVNLPGKLSGWDVAKRARELNEELPVIYMTGASAADWASRGLPRSKLLPKPFPLSKIVTAVLELMGIAPPAVTP